jgi:hypothetical protein
MSCSDFLEENPKSTLTPENSFETAEDWSKLLSGAYAHLQDVFVGKYTITLGEFGTDEVEPYDVGWAAYAELRNYTFSASHAFFNDHYIYCYDGIKRCNSVIDIPSEAPVKGEARELLIAQAKFLRAIYYFDLVRMYGGVPLWTEASVDKNQIMKPRVSADEIYEQIVKDMQDAESVLPESWSSNSDKGRATKHAANALLGRIYLQWGKPSEAYDALSKVYGRFHLYENYADIFIPANKNAEYENIFEVQFSHSGAWGLEGSIQASYWGPRNVGGPTNGGGWGGFGITQYLYDSFSDADQRKSDFFWTSFNGVAQTPPCIKKFYDPTYGNEIEDDDLNFIMIRYADVLLMISEALNETGTDESLKYDCLNQVRSRAGLPAITASNNLTKEQFKDVLLEERLHELCCEHLRRWDLLRFGKLFDQIKVAYSGTINMASYHVLYPIPQTAIDANDAITENNPGY